MKQKIQEHKIIFAVLAAFFWIAVWQGLAMVIGEELFLPSPLAVLRALINLAQSVAFWQSIGRSLLRIGGGFVLGMVLGMLLAVLAAAVPLADVLLRPLMQLVRATPVASLVLITLVWLSSRNLSVFISFLMVLPVIYASARTGIEAADIGLLEMAQVFRVGRWRQIRAIYMPALRPGLLISCELAVGLCWKSGVAAEVMAVAPSSIGGRMYEAKTSLMIPEVFAWTVVVVLLSWLFGKLTMWLLRIVLQRLEGGVRHG